jgi:hypothetical protein
MESIRSNASLLDLLQFSVVFCIKVVFESKIEKEISKLDLKEQYKFVAVQSLIVKSIEKCIEDVFRVFEDCVDEYKAWDLFEKIEKFNYEDQIVSKTGCKVNKTAVKGLINGKILFPDFTSTINKQLNITKTKILKLQVSNKALESQISDLLNEISSIQDKILNEL